MLAYIHGTIISKAMGVVVVDLGNYALKLAVPMSIEDKLPALGSQVKLHTHLAWRDDGPTLYGFSTLAELDLFTKLITVSGVGPKAALSIISFAAPERLLTWLVNENINELRKIPGIGLKTAQRLVLELREKAATLVKDVDKQALDYASKSDPDTPLSQALEAMLALGYESSEALKALNRVFTQNPDISLEQLIRDTLRSLANF